MPKRIDANQPEIVQELREAGVSIQHLHSVGHGCPDILAGFRGQNYLFEIKDGNKPPSKRKLTPDEEEWHLSWNGQVIVIHSAEDALKEMGAI